VDHEPAPEAPSDEFPLLLPTGRTVYQFHTRTKTGRAPELNAAAPEPWVELSAQDAQGLAVSEGDLVRVESARGTVEAHARISGIRPGTVFVPFHFGYWDQGAGEPTAVGRAANELTRTIWDTVSKQPLYKVTAVRVAKPGGGTGLAPSL
jgi:anaerobic selenocysteine-containing dehydrogenase